MPTTAQEYKSRSPHSPKEITLPSGAVFLVRRPNGFWFAANAVALPTALPDGRTDIQASPEESRAITYRNRKMIIDHVVEPKFSESGDLTPDNLNDDDILRLLRYMHGQEDENGVSFRALPQQRVDDTSGANGGTVPLSA